MIAASFKKHWPADRLAKLRDLGSSARLAGFKMTARNGGSKAVFLAHLTFWQNGDIVCQFWSLNEAEAWLRSKNTSPVDNSVDNGDKAP